MTVYFLNSFADYESDIKSKRLKVIGNLSKWNYIRLFSAFGILFCFFAISINLKVLIFSCLSLLLWASYYLPPLRLKSTYLLGTLVHFTAGIFHFHTGYCSYADIGKSSIAVSIYFALLLSTGHIHHELIDYKSDKLSGNKTTAVRIGVRKTLALRTILAGIALLYWTGIYLKGFCNKTEFILFALPSGALFIMSAIISEKEIKKFQKISRSIFLISGIVLLLIKLFMLAKNYFLSCDNFVINNIFFSQLF